MNDDLNYEVIDNFLDSKSFDIIQQLLLGSEIHWNYQPRIVVDYSQQDGQYIQTNETPEEDSFYFTHRFYHQYQPISQYITQINPLIEKLSPLAITRIQANLYPNVNKEIHSPWHYDLYYPHKAALLYINDNNGYTTLKDGTKVYSKANRLLKFDASILHRITYQTDTKVRVIVVMNYF